MKIGLILKILFIGIIFIGAIIAIFPCYNNLANPQCPLSFLVAALLAKELLSDIMSKLKLKMNSHSSKNSSKFKQKKKLEDENAKRIKKEQKQMNKDQKKIEKEEEKKKKEEEKKKKKQERKKKWSNRRKKLKMRANTMRGRMKMGRIGKFGKFGKFGLGMGGLLLGVGVTMLTMPMHLKVERRDNYNDDDVHQAIDYTKEEQEPDHVYYDLDANDDNENITNPIIENLGFILDNYDKEYHDKYNYCPADYRLRDRNCNSINMKLEYI